MRFTALRTLLVTNTADHGASVYDHFYRCLTVQHVLQHIRRYALSNAYISRGEKKTRGPHFKKEEDCWHIFLDSLSILCDHKTGGQTVTSIAAELDHGNNGKRTFWILVNRQHPESETALRASDHLNGLMERLHQSARGVQANEQLMFESFYDSVSKARNRVNNYRKKLQGRIAALKDRATGLSPEGQSSSQTFTEHCISLTFAMLRDPSYRENRYPCRREQNCLHSL